MEIIANALQTVQANQNVYFTDTVVCGNSSTSHRNDSGLVTLHGVTNTQCRARFQITFGANISVPTGETVGPISLAISLEGEPIAATTMIVTPAAVDQFFNVSSSVFIDIPRGCCSSISIKNISTIPVNVQNANLIVERVA
jgi:hypothetical protein